MAEVISKVIFQLEADSKNVAAEMAKVATALTGNTKEIKHQADELKKLQDKELGLLEIRKKTTNPSAIINLTKAIEKNRAEIVKLEAVQKDLNKDTKVYSDQLKGLPAQLDKAFNKQVVASFEKQVAEVTAEQKKLNATISDKAPINSIRGLTQEYKRLVSEAIQAGENTDIGKNFLKQAGEVKDRIGDLQATVKAFGSDTAVFDGIIGGVQGVAAGFEIAQGAAALFGNENEDVQKALLKVNAAMAIANGLQQIQALLQKESAFRIQATTIAQRAYNLVVGQSTGLLRAFKIALAGTGIGLAVIGIQKLVENWDRLKLSIFNTLLGFGNAGIALANTTVAIDNLINSSGDNIQKKIDAANAALEALEKESSRQIELAKAQNKEADQIAIIQLDRANKQKNILAGIQLELEKVREKLNEDQVKSLADFIENFNDAKNDELILESEAVQRRIEERKKIKEADEKLIRETEDLQIEAIKDEHNREVARLKLQEQRRIDEVNATIAHEKEKQKLIIEIVKDTNRQLDKLALERLKPTTGTLSKEGQKAASGTRDIIEENDPLSDPDAEKERQKLLEQRRRDRISNEIEAINTITQATANAAEQAISIEIRKQDALLEIQNKRVQQAALIADRGNAELLQQEQERLDAIQKKREQFVRAQQILQQVEIVGNSIVAVSKAAAQGGVAAPATIAATIAALIAGFALVRTLTQPEGFQEGGYTGDGDPSQKSTKLGHRGYTYHKKEFVFNERQTAKNLPTFMKIHRGEMDLNTTVAKAKLFDSIPMPILNNLLLGHAMQTAQNNVDTSRMELLLSQNIKAIKGKKEASFYFNERGFSKAMKEYYFKEERIKNAAS